MKRMVDFLGLTLGGGVGWWLGAFVGLVTATVISGLGSGVGLYYARRFTAEYLS